MTPATTTFPENTNTAVDVELNTTPSGDVVIQVATGGAAEVLISIDGGGTSAASRQLTFTAGNTPQTVTLAAVADLIDDGDQGVAISFTVDQGLTADSDYDPVTTPDLNVTITDVDTAGITVDDGGDGVTTSEPTVADPDDFTVVLDTKPTDTVVVDITSSLPAEATVSPSSLTFGPLDWATPKLVTVTGADDSVQDGDQPYTISIAIDQGATLDSVYDLVSDPTPVAGTNLDDDVPDLTIGIDYFIQDGPTTFQIFYTVYSAIAPANTFRVDIFVGQLTQPTIGDFSSCSDTLDGSKIGVQQSVTLCNFPLLNRLMWGLVNSSLTVTESDTTNNASNPVGY